ncbi:hypothetical protein GCM10010272_10640 [Streptomyces lateritius]|nr:hypothetical protein GCM10010272_10640 [Streptomyces lateritius]
MKRRHVRPHGRAPLDGAAAVIRRSGHLIVDDGLPGPLAACHLRTELEKGVAVADAATVLAAPGRGRDEGAPRSSWHAAVAAGLPGFGHERSPRSPTWGFVEERMTGIEPAL